VIALLQLWWPVLVLLHLPGLVNAVAVTIFKRIAHTHDWQLADDLPQTAGDWLRDRAASFREIMLAGDGHYLATLPEASNVSSHSEGGVLNYISDHDGKTAPDLIGITSLHYLRWYRHGHAAFIEKYDRLRSGGSDYVLVKRFEADFLNKKLYSALDPMFENYFISPTLEFYERKAQR